MATAQLDKVSTELQVIPKGRFDIGECIGRGGFGEVYKAFDLSRHEFCALKCLQSTSVLTDQEQKCLREEAKLMSQVRDEFVLSIFGVCLEPQTGFYALVLPYMAQGSLQELLRNREADLQWALRMQILYQIAQGMNALHLLNPQVLHMDLKPGNVLLTGMFNVCVADFGLARLKKEMPSLTANRIKGTITHIPPEYLENLHLRPTSKFDVYSYAITMWEILTREIPYSYARNDKHIKLSVIDGQRPNEENVPQDVHPKYELETTVKPLMHRCWEQNPRDRPEFTEIVCGLKNLAEHCAEEACEIVHRKQTTKNVGLPHSLGPDDVTVTSQTVATSDPNHPDTSAALGPSDVTVKSHLSSIASAPAVGLSATSSTAVTDHWQQLEKATTECPEHFTVTSQTASSTMSSWGTNEPHSPEPVTSFGSETQQKAKGGQDGQDECEYFNLCKSYKDQMDIPEVFFDHQYDVCYCTQCQEKRGDALFYQHGVPPKRYALPLGWCRFGIRIHSARAEGLSVASEWHRAFHGTTHEPVKHILETGELVRPGRVTMERISLSPSVTYAGHYATPERTTLYNKVEYNARVALQLFIKPDSYKVGAETIGAGADVIDPLFSNKELEWSTNRQGSTMVYGLLINLEVIDPEQRGKLAKEYIAKGLACWKSGQIQQALENYRHALSLTPDDADIYVNMGVAHHENDDTEKELDCYKHARRLKPDDADVYNNMGEVYRQQGQMKDALDSYKHALRLKPDLAKAYNNMGIVYRQQGQMEDAMNCYKHALRLQPDYADVYNNMGVVYEKQGQLNDALDSYKHALRLNPDDADVYNNMGVVYKQQGQQEEAIKNYKHAIQLKPDYATAHYNLGLLYEKMGQPDDAITSYMNALKFNPDHVGASRGLAQCQKVKKS